jgi:hypothetical protein
MTTTANRLNDLAIESTQTAFETATLLQRQNAALIQSWFSTVEAHQQSGRELLKKALKQAQEAQNLWLQYVQESFTSTTETFAQAQVKNGKKAEPAAK